MNFKNIYQFKIILEQVKPSIWRRIQVPENYSFWDLHVAIQDSMGWSDCHLHDFKLRKPGAPYNEFIRLGIPENEFDSYEFPDWKVKISSWFNSENKTVTYTYDFGDNWIHRVILEKILPRESGIKYPRCLDGRRTCPPEDCGGVGGYYDLLKIIADPKHKEYKNMIEWLGGHYNPDYFNCRDIVFSSPIKRLKEVVESL